MKLFQCDRCSSAIYFENSRCLACNSALGFLSRDLDLHALQPGTAPDLWQLSSSPGAEYRFCANAAYDACNWLVAAGSGGDYCAACRHNRIIPDLSVAENLTAWRSFETAKHRLFYTLIHLGLPLECRAESEHGLAFEFLSETAQGGPVMTGHENGVIVLNLKEADDSVRARVRLEMGEPYRTLLGHLRHESGHYFQGVLVKGDLVERFRELFGDERADYNQALSAYYEKGPPADWPSHYVSSYAAAHPCENFAETWAHYLHIVDTMEMAGSFRLGFSVKADESLSLGSGSENDFSQTIALWSSLTVVMNSLNRCMGQPDLYPFAPPAEAFKRMEFIHKLVRSLLDS